MGEPPRAKPAPKTTIQPSPPIVVEHQAAPPPQPVVPAPVPTITDDPSSSEGGWVEMFWQKWRWGLFIAIAVVVSRLSST
jgi:ubiquitin-conjugating enzyme E2 J2